MITLDFQKLVLAAARTGVATSAARGPILGKGFVLAGGTAIAHPERGKLLGNMAAGALRAFDRFASAHNLFKRLAAFFANIFIDGHGIPPEWGLGDSSGDRGIRIPTSPEPSPHLPHRL
jgi:hypothetical protein